MSTRQPQSDWERAEVMFTCGRCGAYAEWWCVTESGGDARYLHSSRGEQWRKFIRLSGYEQTEDEFMALRREVRGILFDHGRAPLTVAEVVARLRVALAGPDPVDAAVDSPVSS
jgi:hypothetical protein